MAAGLSRVNAAVQCDPDILTSIQEQPLQKQIPESGRSTRELDIMTKMSAADVDFGKGMQNQRRFMLMI